MRFSKGMRVVNTSVLPPYAFMAHNAGGRPVRRQGSQENTPQEAETMKITDYMEISIETIRHLASLLSEDPGRLDEFVKENLS